ncbi:anaerobic ribonucleoside-triphosphate reductase activating protein [bacterium (Candidatus Torokbacteria) CG09_land_8_20_14_0_10_42_11]|nr:MAG: anaerobic ribonucleoside-triphosphate reductase activating protein [bacterium (Candidatus Torokbacteria) CG09_land_8_20_14_0_10_42_11]
MLIRGFQKFSLLDYPGKIAAIIFAPGCTFRCPFCYNLELVLGGANLPSFSEKKVLNFLKKRRGKLEGLVVTGGEPTMQNDLPEFLRRVKKIGYAVKLDTNGSNPTMLARLVKQKLIDYVAMDIKTDWENYSRLAPNVEIAKIKKSVNFLKKYGVMGKFRYEFRTTVAPDFVSAQIMEKIGKAIQGAPLYCLQQYRPQKTLQKDLAQKVYSEKVLLNFKKIAEKYAKKVEIRGI